MSADRGPAALVERLVATVFRAGDDRPLAGLLGTGADEARRSCDRVLGLRAALPDSRWTVDELIAAGDTVAARLTVRGARLGELGDPAGSAHPVTVPLYGMYRVEGGRISEAFHGFEAPAGRAPRAGAGAEPILELADIQGSVFPGFAKDHVAVLSLRMGALGEARHALGVLAGEVATAAEVWAFGRLFARTRTRRGHEGAVSATWVSAALSYPALIDLEPQAVVFADAAFRGTSGRRDGLPDLLLIVAADDPAALDRESARLTAALAPGFVLRSRQRGDALPGDRRGTEHFGFRDGVAQPGVRGRHPLPPHEPVTARLNPGDPDEGKPGQPLVQPGEFVFGYPAEGENGAPGPIADAGPDWARNGSLLVYARYTQDVAAFDRFVTRATAELRRAAPALGWIGEQRVAAMIVGRWRSGAPLVRAPHADDPALGADDRATDDFAYRSARPARPGSPWPPAPADPDGLRCPYAAHVRKANVRDDLAGTAGPGAARRHRMLRRGIPYGPPGADDRDRGLLFLSYQTSIERQFEFVRDRWLDDDSLRRPGEGIDLIVGRSPGPRRFGVPVPGDTGPHLVELDAGQPFTTFAEGGYFFTPGIGGLRRLARAR
ncbi:Dyp-type peroxidase [Symbioplanes lichenis]|uniref:Dyp-type peroxidase n=1 Tax=Symbioplanes lichenis TaxID=1629072 RepID=UPI00273941D2|nr:Dyp-type peroxidase [Actinoplanes lichenis]